MGLFNSKKSDRSDNQTSNDFLITGTAKYAMQDFIGAIVDLNKAIELNPKYSEAYFTRANIKHALQDYAGALEDYSKVIVLNPHDADAYNSRGNTKNSVEDYNGAISDFGKAIELNPKHGNAYFYFYGRGYAEFILKHYSAAINDFNTSIELNPELAIVYYIRGLSKIELGQTDKACLDLNKAGEMGMIQAYEAITELCTKATINNAKINRATAALAGVEITSTSDIFALVG